MAGSFYHLWTAHQAWGELFPNRPHKGADWRAYLAGTVAPDMGFFPGGPQRFSQRLHHEHSGDFIRALLAEAKNVEEQAFAAGWALHIYMDVALHPWVNDWVDLRVPRDGERSERDMWHMRLEWGIDCHLLKKPDAAFMWAVDLHFPPRPIGAELLAEVGQAFFGPDATELDQGALAMQRWLARLPRIFALLGHTYSPVHARPWRWWSRAARPLLGPVLGPLVEWGRGGANAAAVARPWRPDRAQLQEGLALGQDALQAYNNGWQEDFRRLGNPDLDTGLETGPA